MIYSFINFENYAIFDLAAEQVFNNLGEKEPIERGIFIRTLTNSTILKLIDEISKDYLKRFNTIVLDFKNIYNIQNNQYPFFYEIYEIIKQRHQHLLLINLRFSAVGNLELEKLISTIGDTCSFKELQGDFLIAYFSEKLEDVQKLGNEGFNELIQKAFQKRFEDQLTTVTVELEDKRPYPSSPIYLDKFIDIKKFIYQNDFFLYCIYRLAQNMVKSNLINEKKDKSNISLFCQTLNGAYIASILASLFLVDISFIDHIGPINKIYRTSFGKKLSSEKEYIVVSDVVCLGSELNIARSIIDYEGGNYKGSASIVKIKTIDEELNQNEISLYKISKTNNPIDYSIKTSLCCK